MQRPPTFNKKEPKCIPCLAKTTVTKTFTNNAWRDQRNFVKSVQQQQHSQVVKN